MTSHKQDVVQIAIELDKSPTELISMERKHANYAQTECQFRYCGTAIPFLTVRSTAR